ncbi:hypothetical protein [Leucobacter musarum]|uniref:hypothetical protein n=1 Tax=Leucobacter musarum TaxID=1930747 RepID=UPI0006A7C44A|nr:hypothetical protein [Leucobacter musarum]
MRELRRGAKHSQGRDQHRAFYAQYIVSPAWFRRRERWAAEEAARIAPAPIQCRGGCGHQWQAGRDDLHHCSYRRLGDEAHDDLWAMCRTCHTALHRMIESTRSWRRLPRRQANQLAIAVLAGRGRRPPVSDLTKYL